MQSEKPKSDADDMRDVTPDEVQEEIPGSEIKGHLQTDEHSGAEAITDMADYGLTEIEKIALGIHRLEFPEITEPEPANAGAQPEKPDPAPPSGSVGETSAVGSQAEQASAEESSDTASTG
jgi:hypothetical protein